MGRKEIRPKDTKTFEKLVPLLKPLDGLLTLPFGGVSLIAIATPKAKLSAPVDWRETEPSRSVANE